MNNNFLPLKRRGDKMAIRRENDSPMMAIQNEMNRMFDSLFNDPFDLAPLRNPQDAGRILSAGECK